MSPFKIVAITGAGRGLGLELVRQLLEQKTFSIETIYALCRNTSPALEQLALDSSSSTTKVSIYKDIDVSQDTCMSTLQTIFASSASSHQPVAIDLLIHNAGAYGPPETFHSPEHQYSSQTLDNITMDRMRYAFELNTLGPLRVTKALLPNLTRRAAKVIIISSLMGSMADNESGGHYAYRTAKAAVNMVGTNLAIDLASQDVAVGMVHPGYVWTGFQQGIDTEKQPGMQDVGPAVKGILDAIDSVTMENTGTFFHGNYGHGVKAVPW